MTGRDFRNQRRVLKCPPARCSRLHEASTTISARRNVVFFYEISRFVRFVLNGPLHGFFYQDSRIFSSLNSMARGNEKCLNTLEPSRTATLSSVQLTLPTESPCAEYTTGIEHVDYNAGQKRIPVRKAQWRRYPRNSRLGKKSRHPTGFE